MKRTAPTPAARRCARVLMTLVAALAVAAPSAPCAANDTSVGAVAGRPTIIREHRVRMVREDITLERAREASWHVTARYWFDNPTNERVELQLGFPEQARCTCYDCSWSDPGFHDMRTWVEGVEVTMREALADAEGDPEIEAEWGIGPCQRRVFLFDVAFPPGHTVHVEHRFRMSSSLRSGWGESVRYVTVTGANWNGPIGSARFTVRARIDDLPTWRDPESPETDAGPRYDVHFRGEPALVSRREFFHGGARTVELVFEAADWTPTQDVEVVFQTGGFGWPYEGHYTYREHAGFAPAPSVEGLCMLRGGLLAAETLAPVLSGMTTRQLMLARNSAYAAHGYPFRSAELHDFFYTRDATPREPPEPGWRSSFPVPSPDLTVWAPPWATWGDDSAAVSGGVRLLPLMPNPDYSDGLLYRHEVECIRAVRTEERARAAAAP